jgi:hypothetical protein
LNRAKINLVVDRIAAITQATHAFKKNYNALPGDYAYASVHIDSSLINGNGNGQIDTDQERGQAWAHLRAAAFLPHLFVDGNSIPAEKVNCSIKSCPNNTRRQGMVMTYGQSGLTFDSPGNELRMGDNLPIRTLAGLDAYFDDGNSKTGLVQLNKNMNSQNTSKCHYSPVMPPADQKTLCAGVVKLLSH